MLLETISGPDDVRRLTYPELATLAVEIRQFIVDAVTRTGGHLGSNLGAVELTLAVHRVFDSPATSSCGTPATRPTSTRSSPAAATTSSSLRQAGGLSGYPTRAESEHDWIENSHASTVISYAHGLATAVEMGGEPADDRGVAAGPSAGWSRSSATAR